MMLTLANIKDWIKTISVDTVKEINNKTITGVNNTEIAELLESGTVNFSNFYIGKLNNKQEKSLGIYQLNIDNIPNIAIGGLANTKYAKKPISLLVHWNNNADETEIVSYSLYSALQQHKNFYIDNIKVCFIQLLVNEPIDVGTDDANVYERVIQAIFYYEK